MVPPLGVPAIASDTVANLHPCAQTVSPCGHGHSPKVTQACSAAQYSVPVGHAKHFFFFRLHPPRQEALAFPEGLAPGGRQVAGLTPSALTSARPGTGGSSAGSGV